MAKKKTYKGSLFLRKDSSSWWLQFFETNADGKRVRFQQSLGVTSKAEAIKAAEKQTAHLLLKEQADREQVHMSRIASAKEQVKRQVAYMNRLPLAKVWLKFPYDTSVRGNLRRPLKPKVIVKHHLLWEAFVRWAAEHRPSVKFLEDVTEADATAYSGFCQKMAKCGPRGHNDRIKICRVIFDIAGIKPNPFACVKKWSETNEGRDALELVELNKIMEAATGEMRLLVMIGLFTGLRLGDAVTLSWQDIHDGRVYKVTGKNSKPVSLAIAPRLADELSDQPHPANKKGFVMPELAALYTKEPQRLCKKIRHLFESVGIEVVEVVPGRARGVSRRGFHSLRTSFVSICARAGVPTELISQWAGHSPQVNAIYQKFGNKERDDRILGALDKVSGVALTRSMPPPVIDIEATEVPDAGTMRAEICKRLLSANHATLIKILAML